MAGRTATTRKKQKENLPKGIRKLSNGKYIADVTINGVRRTATRSTLEEAIIAHRELSQTAPSSPKRASTAANVTNLSDRWTLEQAYERTRALCWIGRAWEPAARNHYKELVLFFGGPSRYIDTITLDHIDSFVDSLLEKGNSNGTINRKLAVLSKMFNVAHERGKLPNIPKIPRRKEAKHRIRFLTPEEETTMHRLFRQMGYTDHADAMLVLLYTGFRLSECWRLECRDVDLEKGTITAWKTKNGNPRTIPIVDKIRPIIERRMQMNPGGRLFPKAESNQGFENAWRKVKEQMGLSNDKQFIPHALRHTCASRLAQAGVGMIVIKEWMGHNSINTTARYTHLAPRSLSEAAKILSL